MSPLPDRPDLRQLRTQAKELKRALSDGDPEARRRVLNSHPKYAGRPAERMEGLQFSLRDAQVTIAREQGFDSWKDLVVAIEGEHVVRWGERHFSAALGRAFEEAEALGHRYCTGEHLILALLASPERTIAQTVLEGMGMTHEEMAERARRTLRDMPADVEGVVSTPVYHIYSGLAQGIALGMGSNQVTDEHVLLGIVYADPGGDGRLIAADFDSDDVVQALASHGFPVPRLAPPIPETPIGPFGDYVYFPESDFGNVTQELAKRYPPGRSVVWLEGASHWKEGYHYVFGEDEIPMESLIRSSLSDPTAVEVVDHNEAWEREWEARRGSD